MPPNAWKVREAAYVRDWGLAGAGPCCLIGDQKCATGVPTGLQNLNRVFGSRVAYRLVGSDGQGAFA